MIQNAYVADVTYPKGSGKKDKKGVTMTVGGAPLDPDQMALFVEAHNLFPGASSVKIREVPVTARPRSLSEMVKATRDLAAAESKRSGKPVAVTPKVSVEKAPEGGEAEEGRSTETSIAQIPSGNTAGTLPGR